MTTRNYLLGALFGFAALLALLCAAACPAHAQNPYVTIEGTLQGPNGLPAANSIISLTPTQQFVVPGTGSTVCAYDYFIQINESPLAPCDTLDFNSTTPAAPGGYSNVIFQTTKVGTTDFISGYAPTNNGLYCQLVGGSGCIMTGAIEGNTSYTDAVFGPIAGGLSLIDSTGNLLHSGIDGTLQDLIYLTTGDGNAAIGMGGAVLNGGVGLFSNGSVAYGNILITPTGGISLIPPQATAGPYRLPISFDPTAMRTFANNAAALAGGLVAGNLYRNGADPDMLAIVDAVGGTKPTRTCQTGLGDGLNAIASGTYLQTFCLNDSGATWTITGIKCYTDNSGSSILAATDNSANALLTGPVTCASTFVGGTQSAHVTIPAGGWVKFSFAADGTSTQTTWVMSLQ